MNPLILQQARLPISVDLASIQREVDDLTGWQAHFNTRQYSGSWSALSLRAPGGQSHHIIPDALNDLPYADTELMERSASIQQLLHNFSCDLLSVRLLNLAAGARIAEHRDHGLAFEQGEARLHIPIRTNTGVGFYVNGAAVPMPEGSCWYINANLPHRVANEGASDRIHLVIDCVVNDWLRSLFAGGEQVFCAPAPDTGTRAVIDELRRQSTPFALRLADDMERQLRNP